MDNLCRVVPNGNINDSPVAANDKAFTNVNDAVVIPVLDNDSDAEDEFALGGVRGVRQTMSNKSLVVDTEFSYQQDCFQVDVLVIYPDYGWSLL